MLGHMLESLYEIEYAEDGEKALDTIKSEKYKLSLIILDLHMPKLDGYSLLEILHSDPELRRIPAIVLDVNRFHLVNELYGREPAKDTSLLHQGFYLQAF